MAPKRGKKRPAEDELPRGYAKTTKQAWRTFMRAHLQWYEQQHNGSGYMKLWKEHGKKHWDDLTETQKDFYVNASAGDRKLETGHPPPRNDSDPTPPFVAPIAPPTFVPPITSPTAPLASQSIARPTVSPISPPPAPATRPPRLHQPPLNSHNWRDPGNHVEIPHIQNQKTKSGEDGYSDDDVDVEQDENKDPYTDQAGHQWQVAHQLGKGAFGTVELWVESDEHGNALETLAMKQCQSLPNSALYWIDRDSADGGVPSEVSALRTLAANGGCPYVVDYKGFRLSEDRSRFRLAMPAAEFGDATTFVKRWDEQNPETALPEALLVDIYLGLMRGGQHMTDCNMLHNDWKPDNILIGEDAANHLLNDFTSGNDINGPGWGLKPMITDLGIASPIDGCKYWLNPSLMNGSRYTLPSTGGGTKGWRGPEHIRSTREVPAGEKVELVCPVERVDSKATIFGIGASLFTMMNSGLARYWAIPRTCQFDRDAIDAIAEPDYNGMPIDTDLYLTPIDEPTDHDDFMEDVFEEFRDLRGSPQSKTKPEYRQLENYLKDALRFQPKDRPTFEDLLRRRDFEKEEDTRQRDPALFANMRNLWSTSISQGVQVDQTLLRRVQREYVQDALLQQKKENMLEKRYHPDGRPAVARAKRQERLAMAVLALQASDSREDDRMEDGEEGQGSEQEGVGADNDEEEDQEEDGEEDDEDGEEGEEDVQDVIARVTDALELQALQRDDSEENVL